MARKVTFRDIFQICCEFRLATSKQMALGWKKEGSFDRRQRGCSQSSDDKEVLVHSAPSPFTSTSRHTQQQALWLEIWRNQSTQTRAHRLFILVKCTSRKHLVQQTELAAVHGLRLSPVLKSATAAAAPFYPKIASTKWQRRRRSLEQLNIWTSVIWCLVVVCCFFDSAEWWSKSDLLSLCMLCSVHLCLYLTAIQTWTTVQQWWLFALLWSVVCFLQVRMREGENISSSSFVLSSFDFPSLPPVLFIDIWYEVKGVRMAGGEGQITVEAN